MLVLLMPMVQGCSDRAREEALPPELADLAQQLRGASAATELSAAEGQDLAAALGAFLPSAETLCASCSGDLLYVDQDGGDHFSLVLRTQESGDVARLELFYRPDLTEESMEGWGSEEIGGRPASVFADQQVFVWAGHFEIRAFALGEPLQNAAALQELVVGLPLGLLARL